MILSLSLCGCVCARKHQIQDELCGVGPRGALVSESRKVLQRPRRRAPVHHVPLPQNQQLPHPAAAAAGGAPVQPKPSPADGGTKGSTRLGEERESSIVYKASRRCAHKEYRATLRYAAKVPVISHPTRDTLFVCLQSKVQADKQTHECVSEGCHSRRFQRALSKSAKSREEG